MKIIGLTRIRNEEEIIKDTLDHMSTFCTGGVYIYDDDSTDNTLKIIEKHPIVRGIIKGQKWDNNREKAEYENRQAVLIMAKKYANKDDWFIYIDADERIEYNWEKLNNIDPRIIGIKMRLFDFYITEEDKDKDFKCREYIGPEYRDILMVFRNTKELKYYIPDQREVYLGKKGKIILDGYIKHYGKAISINQWEETCNYYATHFPKYAKKWEARKGKAIHSKSDFGLDLIKWDEKGKKGTPLWKIELKNQNSIFKFYLIIFKFYILKCLVFLKKIINNINILGKY